LLLLLSTINVSNTLAHIEVSILLLLNSLDFDEGGVGVLVALTPRNLL
jgi:hypothetical protein